MNYSEMNMNQEIEFLETWKRFGREQCWENFRILGEKLFDGRKPSAERIELDVLQSDDLEDCDKETRDIAKKQYVAGWSEEYDWIKENA